jgi:hypothetical protein
MVAAKQRARNLLLLVGFLLLACPALRSDPNAEPFAIASLHSQAARPTEPLRRFRWGQALRQASHLLAVQHAYRIGTEENTVQELRGPFFKDYWRSVRGIGGWDDGDEFYVNYVGHPMQGAVAGYIAVHNDPLYQLVEFGQSGYWRSRIRATGFSALHSTLFEIGPASEASIGNVGKDASRSGMVDFVVTPLGGLGVMVLEDSLDRYVVRRLERWNSNRYLVAVCRTMLNPSRSFANLMRLKRPWYRDRAQDLVARRY